MTDTIEHNGKSVIPGTSIETRLLVDMLRAKKEGDVVTHSEIEATIGRPARAGEKGYGYFSSARRIVESENRIVLAPERGNGYRVCTDGEKLQVAGAHQKRAHRAIRRSVRTLGAADRDKLTDDERRHLDARASIAGAIALMTTARSVETFDKRAARATLPSADVLRLFAGDAPKMQEAAE